MFQKGDKVSAFGCTGVVKCISNDGHFVEVTFPEAPGTVIFNIDGKLFRWAKEVSLTKILE